MLIILGAFTSHAKASNVVSDDGFLSIWKQRYDLQSAFPEVAQGKLDNLIKWPAKRPMDSSSDVSKAISILAEKPLSINNTLDSFIKEVKPL